MPRYHQGFQEKMSDTIICYQTVTKFVNAQYVYQGHERTLGLNHRPREVIDNAYDEYSNYQKS